MSRLLADMPTSPTWQSNDWGKLLIHVVNLDTKCLSLSLMFRRPRTLLLSQAPELHFPGKHFLLFVSPH
jgi:hypothetical protein